MSNRTTRFATAYEVAGDGPCVVFVHGLGLARWMWREQTPVFSKDLGTAVSYDLLGHGETPSVEHPVTLTDFSEQLLELIDALEVPQCAVVGFSLGGMIARRFAHDHPDRVWALVIASSAHRRTAPEREAVRQRAQQARHHGPSSTSSAAVERWFTNRFVTQQPETIQAVKDQIEANDPLAYANAYDVLAAGDESLDNVLTKVDVPVLAITGSDDVGNSARMSEEMANQAPRGEHHIVPGLRHMGLLEHPPAFNDPILQHLKRAAPEAVAEAA